MKSHNLSQHGFTLLELVVVIIIISILGLVAVNRSAQWGEIAERAGLQTVVGTIRTALGLETARLAIHHHLDRLPNLVDTNPMDLLAQTPDNYTGTVEREARAGPEGSWYFVNSSHLLVYHLKRTDGFSSQLTGAPRVRFRIKLIYTDNNHNGRFDRGIDDIGGLDLVPAEAFSWQPPQP